MEVRRDEDGEVDEVVAKSADVHLEVLAAVPHEAYSLIYLRIGDTVLHFHSATPVNITIEDDEWSPRRGG